MKKESQRSKLMKIQDWGLKCSCGHTLFNHLSTNGPCTYLDHNDDYDWNDSFKEEDDYEPMIKCECK